MKKMKKKYLGAPTSPEDEAISLFAGLLANPDMVLSTKTTQYVGGQSVSEKSQTTGTSKNLFENQTVRHNISFVRSRVDG